MSKIATKTVKLGDSADSSKNFLISVPSVPDGTLTIERESGTDVLKVAAAGGVSIQGGVVAPGAGMVGELIEASFSTPVSIASTTPTTVASITLTPGVWDVQGLITFGAVTGPSVMRSAYLSLTTNSPSGPFGQNSGTMQAGYADIVNVLPRRFVVTVNTSIYLVQRAAFSSGSMTAESGLIQARRVA